MPNVPDIRIQKRNKAPELSTGKYVLYWMISARRANYNFALEHAANLAEENGVGLLVLEALRCDYKWASDRFHQFIIEGMRDNQESFEKAGVAYYPYVEESVGAGKGLLLELAKQATAVVTDEFPCFFHPKMVATAAKKLDCPLYQVDGNGLYPLRATERVFTTAASFRRHLQKDIPKFLVNQPRAYPLRNRQLPPVQIPAKTRKKWPLLAKNLKLAALPIDHSVFPGAQKGGAKAARNTLNVFLADKLKHYGEMRNEPEKGGQSCLSPYLHFGHISSHQIFSDLMRLEGWTPEKLAPKANGSRHGWWGVSQAAESFLDELITWREIGLNMCFLRSDYAKYQSLPGWAKVTLDEHAQDKRAYLYTRSQLEKARTHDPLWNAAQNQLVRDGIIHNYLRMLWGKKILEWTKSPKLALKTMLDLNNKYALDGRNPNSYSGIYWVLGRYDRAWGPERQIFGKIRYMSSQNTARKVKVKNYIKQYESAAVQGELFKS